VLFVIPIIVFVIIACRIRAASRPWTPRRTVISTSTPASTRACIITARRTTYQRLPTFNYDAPPPYTQCMESYPPPSQEQPSQVQPPSQQPPPPPQVQPLPQEAPPPPQEQPPSKEQPLPQEPPLAYKPPAQADGYNPDPQTF